MVDTAKHVPFFVETVYMKCHVTTSMEFVKMVVPLVGQVINVIKVSQIKKKQISFQSLNTIQI